MSSERRKLIAQQINKFATEDPELAASIERDVASKKWFAFHIQEVSDHFKIVAKRDKNCVELKWKAFNHRSQNYSFSGTIFKVAFASEDGIELIAQLDWYPGDDKTLLTLSQGCVYLFYVYFISDDESARPEFIAFQICVPLSPDNERVLVKAINESESPTRTIKRFSKQFLKAHKALAAAARAGIEQIKAQKLPIDDEEDLVLRYKESLARLRERLDV